MSKEEIKDFLEINTQEEVIEYIYNLETEYLKTKEALEVAREVILKESVSKERYNAVLKKYNEIAKKRGLK